MSIIFVGFAVGQPEQIFGGWQILMEQWNLQPARDTGLTPAERFRSVRREADFSKTLRIMFVFTVAKLFRYRTSTHDCRRERLPAHGHLCSQRIIAVISTHSFLEQH